MAAKIKIELIRRTNIFYENHYIKDLNNSNANNDLR